VSSLDLVVFGLSLSSSWGNGHATTFRALLKAFASLRHRILYLERDQPWYAEHRDLLNPDFCSLRIYGSLAEIESYREGIARADAVLVGSFVPDGVAIGRYVQRVTRGIKVFYDIDTPVTLRKLANGECSYLSSKLIPGYDLYLSFTGGESLNTLEQIYASPAARPLYCSVDTAVYVPTGATPRYDLGYLGTYSPDRQPSLDRLLVEPARRAPHRSFIVGGALYPAGIEWPSNVDFVGHVPPADHAAFYNSCRFALNVTRADMVSAGYSPSVRLFEAAACGTPIISDDWAGLDTLFTPAREIALATEAADVIAVLDGMNESARRVMADRARARILAAHTATQRALEFESYLRQAAESLGNERHLTGCDFPTAEKEKLHLTGSPFGTPALREEVEYG
jgi:spore maturation protein CgeB